MSFLAHFNSKEAHPFLQLIKYGICGVGATILHNGLVAYLSYYVYPAVDGMIVDGAPITDTLRANNLFLNNLIAFPIGCIFAYVTNVMWVFTPGKHSRLWEMILFFGIATIGFIAGVMGGPMLIKWFGISSALSQLAFVFTSFLVNFICRKFLIFHK